MVPHRISSPWLTANPLTLLVVSDCSSGNSSIALAKAAVVAGLGGSYPHRFTLLSHSSSVSFRGVVEGCWALGSSIFCKS